MGVSSTKLITLLASSKRKGMSHTWRDFYHILCPPYFGDGGHWGQASPALCLSFPDLCSPLTWVLISLLWRKSCWLFSCQLCSLYQHQCPLSYNLKNSIFIPFTQTIHTIARDSQFYTLVKQLAVIVSTYWISLLCMELQEALSHQQ